MTMHASTIDSIRKSLVGLRMPRALEALDATLRRIEQGEIDGAHHNFRVQWRQKSGVVYVPPNSICEEARNDKDSRTRVRFFYLASC
ncbi:hypothetical protein RFM98_30975 [Mesorhizobium sp. VK9D]|nr:hypothetical protein [Mesorhizobium sp. VK9D]MDX8457150.1 hypothetical protein [Mesorhizobium sp. VK9D]